MHGGMPCGLIRGYGQGHVALKFRNSSIFKILSPPPFSMGAGK